MPVSRPRSIRVVRFLLVGIAAAGGLTVVTAPLALLQQASTNQPEYLADPLFGIIEATVLGALCLPDYDNPLPGWYLPVHYTVEIGCLLAVLVMAWLLRTQSASDFFDASAPSTPADEARIWDISRIRR